MLIEIKELCNKSFGRDGYIDQDDTMYINTDSISFIRFGYDTVERLITNPDYKEGVDNEDEEDVFVSSVEKVYSVHTVGCSEADIIVIDELGMSVLKGAL